MELYMNSIAISSHSKSVPIPKSTPSNVGVGFILPVRGKPDSAGHIDSQRTQESSAEPSSSLPVSSASPIRTRNETSAQSGKLAEDPAISRLRGYTISIKSQAPLDAAKSAILAHWPLTPGADPSTYSWETTRTALTGEDALDSDEEEASKRQKEEARRKRRSEKLLRSQRTDVMEAASQPAQGVPFGSQPTLAQHILSSQPNDIPMTQPVTGLFGSRHGRKGFKKKRVSGF
jgi:RNA polymerase I-specific transcription initiation factor RRN6